MNNFFYHLKTAIRNLRRGKMYSVINIGGLAVSMATVILIMLWVWDELSYDRFHRNADNLYRINTYLDKSCWDMSPFPLAEKMKQEMPQVESYCRFTFPDIAFLEYNGQKFYCEDKVADVDTSFFTMFDFHMLKGDCKSMSPLSLVISNTVATKLFGNREPVGEMVTASNKQTYQVAAVIEDMPANSTIQYTTLFFPDRRDKTKWVHFDSQTYVQLRPGSNAGDMDDEITELAKRGEPEFALMHGFKMDIQNIKRHHLYVPDGKESGIQTVRLFFIIAVLILVIACVNYVNMVTARAGKRTKEVGLRKVLGASKSNLLGQLMNEAILLFQAALLLALLVAFCLMPYYNDLTAKTFDFISNLPQLLAVCAGIFLVTMLLAGVYPAFMLSSSRSDDQSIKRGQAKNSYLRKTLVIVQFVFSIGLLFGTMVMERQLDHIQNMNLGYDKENVVMVQMFDMKNRMESVRGELLAQPAILEVSAGSEPITKVQSGSNAEWEGQDPGNVTMMTSLNVDEHFIRTLGLTLAEGIDFTGTVADSNYFIVNETAAQLMEMDEPVGKYLKFRSMKGSIIGVLNDFHFSDMHKKISPIILSYNPHLSHSLLYIKTGKGQTREALAGIEKIWKRYNAEYQFTYEFVDDTFEQLHRADLRTGHLFSIFAVIAIFISCLGLFGLVTYTAETKTKEIGIRKVLGASVAGIVELLSKEFLILVGIAMLIAFPLAYYWLDRMLQDYAYRIDISWWMFATAGIITIVLTLLTVGWQAVKAATANPVKSLKTE